MKHWFDLVFEYQFAYGSKGDQLKGKNFVSSFTVGSAESSYNVLGFQHFRVCEFCKNLEQTALFAHMNYIYPVYFNDTSLAAGYTAEDIKNKAKRHAEKLISKLNELK